MEEAKNIQDKNEENKAKAYVADYGVKGSIQKDEELYIIEGKLKMVLNLP